METFFNIYNLTNSVVTILSIAVAAYCVYRIMKRKKKVLLYCSGIVLALVVLILCIRELYKDYDLWYKIVRKPQTYYIADLNLSPKQCMDDFESIIEIVNENYADIADYKGIDLQKLNTIYKERVANVENAQQYGGILLEYFAKLRNNHTYPYFDGYMAAVSLATRKDSIWVTTCQDRDINLQKKDLIVSINGLSTADYISQKEELVCASSDIYRQKYAALTALTSYTDTCIRLQIRRNEAVLDVSVPLYKEDEFMEKFAFQKDSLRMSPQQVQDKLAFIKTKFFKALDDIGYIQIKDFEPGCVQRFCQQMDSVKNCPRLILDLRNNGGGIQGLMTEIASYLLQKNVTIGNLTIKGDRDKCYKGNIYVLVNTFTGSASEILLACLKKQSNVLVIGELTGGDCGFVKGLNFKSRYNIEFKLATSVPPLLPDGTPSEGKGIAPDIIVEEGLPWENWETSLIVALNLIKQDKLKNN